MLYSLDMPLAHGGGGRSVDPEPLLEGHLGFPDGTPETHRPGEGSPSTQQGL